MLVGIGIGVFALIVIGVFALGGSKDGPQRPNKEVLRDEDDKTPSPILVKLADRALADGRRSDAVRYLTRAAAAAEREGSPTLAKQYNMRAMTLMKSSTLQDR
jgi:hypothetical protein